MTVNGGSLKINVKLLRKIQEAIREEPKRINMASFVIYPSLVSKHKLPACKTVGCIGGWAVALTTKRRGYKLYATRGLSDIAQEVLKLTSDQADRLFHGAFPNEHPGTKRYAEAVCKRIDRFIETEGAE